MQFRRAAFPVSGNKPFKLFDVLFRKEKAPAEPEGRRDGLSGGNTNRDQALVRQAFALAPRSSGSAVHVAR
jgi:hypothetical protein